MVIHLPKSVEEVVATLAVARQGTIFVNIHHRRTLDQLRHAVADSGAETAFVDEARADELARAGVPAGLQRVVVVGTVPAHPHMVSWSEVGAEIASEPARVAETEVAALLYTSGSTGRPKGVVLAHRNLLLAARSVVQFLENRPGDRVLSVLPLSFDYGLNQLTTMLWVGGALVLQPVPMAAEIVATARAERITGIGGIPTLWIPIVRCLLSQPTPLLALRYVTNSGGAIPPSILHAMPSVLGAAKIFLMSGLPEAFRSTFLAPELFLRKPGAIGRAIPHAEVFVIGERGICGPGEEGELVHRGELISLGYWNAPELSAQKIRRCPELAHRIGDEKVCFSGDRDRIDEDGDLWYVGRTDAMIKVSGVRVSPSEVEEVLIDSGLVAEAVAYGVADELLGQVVHAAVVGDGPVDRAALLRHCRARLPGYLVPREIRVWDGELPRTGNGKPDRPAIASADRR